MSDPQVNFDVRKSEILSILSPSSGVVKNNFIPLFFATDDLCDILHDELPWVKKDLWGNVPWRILVYVLVNVLALVQEKFRLDGLTLFITKSQDIFKFSWILAIVLDFIWSSHFLNF